MKNLRGSFWNPSKEFKKREIHLSEPTAKVCKYLDLSETAVRAPGKNRLESHARAVLALLVRESENLSIKKSGIFLALDASGLSKLANRLERKCSESPILAGKMDDLRKFVYHEDH